MKLETFRKSLLRHYMVFDANGEPHLVSPGDPEYKTTEAAFNKRIRGLFGRVPTTGRETYDYMNPLKVRP